MGHRSIDFSSEAAGFQILYTGYIVWRMPQNCHMACNGYNGTCVSTCNQIEGRPGDQEFLNCILIMTQVGLKSAKREREREKIRSPATKADMPGNVGMSIRIALY